MNDEHDRELAKAILNSLKNRPEEWKKGSSCSNNYLEHVHGQRITYYLCRSYGDSVYFHPWFGANQVEKKKIVKAVKGWFLWEDNLPENVARRQEYDREEAAKMQKRIKDLAVSTSPHA